MENIAIFKDSHTYFYFIFISVVSLVYSADVISKDMQVTSTTYDNCAGCHQSQVNDWRTSDHAKAMAIVSKESVLGNFNQAQLNHYTQIYRFYRKNEQYWVNISSSETPENTIEYQIEYTFGHYPLQQYLVKTDKGKYQVLPFAWDSRKENDGGQRWYPMYENEDIKANDRLHWKQPLQNWNGMCADCHSDGLERRYNVKDNSFDTIFDNINVGCLSCHGEDYGKEHAKQSQQLNTASLSDNTSIVKWVLSLEENNASWAGTEEEKLANRKAMDTCFACHSLRSPLSDKIQAKQPYLDQFSPSLLSAPLYHADGQIKEEVYVYGSFLQSKMYEAGVTCKNCHDNHTAKIKTNTNGLCLQCHKATTYDVKEHHQHSVESEGSQCVNCHMPTTTYMGVDDRRDHSFKIPRPHLSSQFNTPNACIQCHTEKSDIWAANTLKQWFGEPKAQSSTQLAYMQLQSGHAISLSDHLDIISDGSLNEIIRATAISLLPASTQRLSDTLIKEWINEDEPLVRLAIAKVGHLLPDSDKTKSLAILLKDEYRAIRVAAALPMLSVTKQANADKHYQTAFNELALSNDLSAWRGEGHLNQSMMHTASGQLQSAISSLLKSIEVDPYFDASYINLADMYRTENNSQQEAAILSLGITNNNTSAILHYSYGLHLIRSKEKLAAVNSFTTAATLEPANSQYVYLMVLALDNINKTQRGLEELKARISSFPKAEQPQLAQLGMDLSRKIQDRSRYDFFAKLR